MRRVTSFLLAAAGALGYGLYLARPAPPTSREAQQLAPPVVAVPGLGPSSAPAFPGPAAPTCVQPAAYRPAPPPPKALNGQLGLWVAVIDPRTLQPLRAVAYAPQRVFPLASTYKQAVLWALLRQVDEHKVNLSSTYAVSRASQSLGAYPYDGMSARDLAGRMIQYSDNTATDLLHRKVGLQAVQNVADDLGLCRTRLILPTKAWWAAQSGHSPTFSGTSRWVGASGAARLQLATLIDADAQKVAPDYLQRQLDLYFDHRYNSDDDMRVHNLSTPFELSTLVAHEFLRPGLSASSQALQRKLMALGYGKAALRSVPVAEWGGKGGNGWKILTYSGYLKTKGGEHVVYTFMLHGSAQTYTMPLTHAAFAWIRAGLTEVLRPGDGGRVNMVVSDFTPLGRAPH